LKTRSYKSLDLFTGGFNQFELYLKSDGKFEMILQTSRSIVSDSNGDTWTEISKNEKGTWSIRKNKISCTFINNKSSIDSLFENSDFRDFQEKDLLKFSLDLDTAYIYGIPCLLED
jgi:uncharacterized protein YegP (UPF0339 family)